MTDSPHSDDELTADPQLARRLVDERPVPRAAFRGALGRRLAAADPGHGPRPARLTAIVSAWVAGGLLVLAIGVLQALGRL